MQHFLNFWPLPLPQRSLRPILSIDLPLRDYAHLM
jgi:hypothetical protein